MLVASSCMNNEEAKKLKHVNAKGFFALNSLEYRAIVLSGRAEMSEN